jgi:hypothetical protein
VEPVHNAPENPDQQFKNDLCDLASAFDPARLSGAAQALPPEYAIIPDAFTPWTPSP